jgi:hypothetical protein
VSTNQGLETPTTPFFSNVGTDGARKPDNVSRKKREVSQCSSFSPKEENPAGNSFEKMIS